MVTVTTVKVNNGEGGVLSRGSVKGWDRHDFGPSTYRKGPGWIMGCKDLAGWRHGGRRKGSRRCRCTQHVCPSGGEGGRGAREEETKRKSAPELAASGRTAAWMGWARTVTDAYTQDVPCREVVVFPHEVAHFLEGELAVEVDDGLAMGGPFLWRRALQRPGLGPLVGAGTALVPGRRVRRRREAHRPRQGHGRR